jgi:transcriptional regulator with XRE-family HTH domain
MTPPVEPASSLDGLDPAVARFLADTAEARGTGAVVPEGAPSAHAGHGPAPSAPSAQEETRSPFALALGQRLRLARQRRKLSLQGVEQSSQGRFKAVVIGSYERGDRAVTVQRLVELAEFYELAPGVLIPEAGASAQSTRIVLDLDRLTTVPREQSAPLIRYTQTIRAQRGEDGGSSLPIRVEDLLALAVIYDASPRALTEQLIDWGILSPEARTALEGG